MTDLAVVQPAAHAPELRQSTRMIAGWLNRLFPRGDGKPVPSAGAAELAGITRADRYDIAPWLSF
jgi:hypothetical protein